jgi:NAD(P)-dependent dehydrogenase (short-subunit alcohol dehydrogenase family)
VDLGLKGKRVLVTGAIGGIGTAISKTLAQEGAYVALNYVVDPPRADALAAELNAVCGDAFAVKADVSDEADVAAMFATLDARWQGIDILVNNAGIDGRRSLAWKAETPAWTAVIDINLKGAFLCAREALRRMVHQRSGVILNTSSVHELIAWTGYSAYAASKAGLSMMAKTLAQEAAPHGVRVLCLAPGAIKTPINQSVWTDPSQLRDLISKIPLGRIGEPDEIARMAAVLVSEISSYITATTVFVDGGMTDYPSFSQGG